MKTFHTLFGSFYSFNRDNEMNRILNEGSVPIVERYLEPFILSASTVLHVGSKIGAIDMFIVSLNSRVNIYSFEPRDKYFSVLCKNINLNNCENVVVLNNALGHVEGLIKVPKSYNEVPCDHDDIIELDNGRLIAENDSYHFVTLDSLNLLSCDMIYVDLPEFEYLVIMGGLNTIRKYKPVICFYDVSCKGGEGGLLSSLKISNKTVETLNRLDYNVCEVQKDVFIAQPKSDMQAL
jgi:FkbM family methyltransferase